MRGAGSSLPAAKQIAAMRELIFAAAREVPAIGELEESLKWGQPSFTPKGKRIGSSIRLGVTGAGEPAFFFICHTRLVEDFREIHGDVLRYEGNRAIIADGEAPPEVLKHCIAMALTYHLKGKQDVLWRRR